MATRLKLDGKDLGFWNPKDHLQDTIKELRETMEMFFKRQPKTFKWPYEAKLIMGDFEYLINDLQEIHSDLKEECQRPAAPQKISLVVNGEIAPGPARNDFRPGHNLNLDKANEIREKYLSGMSSQLKLAKEYGVDIQMINRIVRNRSWKDLAV